MSFQTGLSGLGAASTALDVIGNNIANSGTAGFKSATTNFSDVYAASLNHVGASQIGIGVGVSAIQQQFTQGNVSVTDNPLDLALNGDGFFRMSRDGAVTYTRNGQFHTDLNGYVVNDQNARLTGYPATATGLILPSNPVELQLSVAATPPRATSDPLAGNMAAVLNLDARDTAPAAAFDPLDPASYNFSTAMNVFDSLGVAHTLSTYFVRNAPAVPAPVPPIAEWTVHATLDGVSPVPAAPVGTLTFDSSGVLSAGALQALPASWTLAGGAATPWTPGSIDFTGTTQFGIQSSVDRLSQGGYTSGSLVGVGVGSDGIIQGRYSNGQTLNLGQVVVATFANPNGLLNLGNNQWGLSAVSGPELVGAPGSGKRGVIQSAAIEESNVDLTKQLVDMITAQRNYQANAETIKTQDQLIQTLLNLR